MLWKCEIHVKAQFQISCGIVKTKLVIQNGLSRTFDIVWYCQDWWIVRFPVWGSPCDVPRVCVDIHSPTYMKTKCLCTSLVDSEWYIYIYISPTYRKTKYIGICLLIQNRYLAIVLWKCYTSHNGWNGEIHVKAQFQISCELVKTKYIDIGLVIQNGLSRTFYIIKIGELVYLDIDANLS